MKIADCRWPMAEAGGRRGRLLTTTAAAAALAALLLAPGCSSPQMKGTPFYTGEYAVRRGPAENRINGWPLIYYREPALSVLWPLGELTEDHFAIRPVLSVYGLEGERREYNILWPLMQFDRKTGDNRILPAFWGRDYACVFPLYWHEGSPYAGKPGHDVLFPLWSYARDTGGYSTWFAGPLIHFTEERDSSGWHVLPLAGRYTGAHGMYRFVGGPLFHQWSGDDGGTRGNALLPLYGWQQSRTDSRFFSLLYASRRAADGDGWRMVTPLCWDGASRHGAETWRLVAPLYYGRTTPDGASRQSLLGGYRQKADTTSWWALPALAWGHTEKGAGDFWVLGPIAHRAWAGDAVSHHVAPLYYRSVSDEGSRFLSLPWSSRVGRDGDGWQLLPPLYYRSRSAAGETTITPLYGQGRAADGKSGWQALLPLYYRQRSDEGELLATLLGGYRTDARGKQWLIYPLLTYWSSAPERSDFWTLGGLAHFSGGEQAGPQHIAPLYYRNPRTGTFLSPLYAAWKTDDEKKARLVPPALTYWSSAPERSDFWTLGGLAHFSGGEQAGPQHVAPLYYRNPRTGTFLSLPYAAWRKDDRSYAALPPLLSMYSSRGKEREINGLLGFWNEQWGAGEREGHLIPLYLYRGGKQVYTPLFGWNQRTEDAYFYPLTPLLGIRTDRYAGGWLFPLFAHKRDRTTDNVDGRILWGGYDRQGEKYNSGLWPLFGYHNHGPAPATATGQVQYATFGRDFWSLPACWYENTTRVWPEYEILPVTNGAPRAVRRTDRSKATPVLETVRRNGVFPLWTYSRRATPAKGALDTESSLLLLLYDYQHRLTPAPGPSAPVSDYTRARILWRLWHYERSNGDISVDIFPAITYDAKTDGYTKTTFLWRAFRYEHSAKGKNVDLLFIPVWRGKG